MFLCRNKKTITPVLADAGGDFSLNILSGALDLQTLEK
jgi:hypothetical protein